MFMPALRAARVCLRPRVTPAPIMEPNHLHPFLAPVDSDSGGSGDV